MAKTNQSCAQSTGADEMTWTTELPTEPGPYWVSLDPELRPRTETITVGECRIVWNVLHTDFIYRDDCTCCLLAKLPPCFKGAKWAKREVPADPWVTP